MCKRRGKKGDGRKARLERFSVMSLDIKHSPPSPNLDVISSRCRNVGSVRNTGLVDTLSGLDNLIQPRRDFRWRDPTAKDIPSRDRGSVKLSIGVLPLN